MAVTVGDICKIVLAVILPPLGQPPLASGCIGCMFGLCAMSVALAAQTTGMIKENHTATSDGAVKHTSFDESCSGL